MKTRLDKFRTRWFRWLGQKTRWDKSYWTELLDSDWSGWAQSVLEKHGFDLRVPIITDPNLRMDIYHYYRLAICEADMQDLIKLDNLFCTDLIEKRGW